MGNKRGLAYSYINTAATYRRQGNYEKAYEYNRKSYAILEEIADKTGMANASMGLATIYNEQEIFDKALIQYEIYFALV